MSREKGNIAEAKAREFLVQKGFRIVETNFYSKLGEIDIIALKNNVIHFVEVKSGDTFEPIYNITPAKLTKIIDTADYFLKIKKLSLPFCIDAVIIKQDDISFYENITL